mmetsp:Transcript_7106/g.21887  ORF Transcript_7106/g.21887 Transcript_7106/m.21887 type:complete len:210 (-) Transcript_7106:145-774(-)
MFTDRPVPVESRDMILGWVTHVLVEAILWVRFVQLLHEAVSCNFGYDGGGSDRVAPRVPLDERLRVAFEILWAAVTVDERQGGFELRRKVLHGGAHRQHRCLQDVDVIDGCVVNDADSDADARVAHDLVVQRITYFRAQRLRVVYLVQRRLVQRPDAGGSDNGPRKWSPTRLIHTGDLRSVVRALKRPGRHGTLHRRGEPPTCRKAEHA